MIHDATTVNKERKDRKTSMEVKKPYAVVQYNKFMMGLDRAIVRPIFVLCSQHTVLSELTAANVLWQF
jgi:hypothetical protein